MSTTVKARTARIAHLCENCHWIPSLRGQATIAPGHRYLAHTAFPSAEMPCDAPWRIAECVACATGRGYAPGPPTGACLTHCCGDMPCAKPEQHDGNHSCRRCMTGGAA